MSHEAAALAMLDDAQSTLTKLRTHLAAAHPPTSENPVPAGAVVGLGAHALEDRDLLELLALGVRHTRTTLYVQTWHELPEWREAFVRGLHRAAALGIEILVVVHQIPPGWRPHDLAAFLADRARELPVDAWQIGNEVPFGEDHAVFHRLGRDAIKAVRPDVEVLTLADPHFDLQEHDLVAEHLYGYPVRGINTPRGLRRVWVTEVGLEQKVIPLDHQGDDWEAVQAREIRAGVERAEAHGAERVYIYQLRTDGEETHGLVRRDGSLTPAAMWLRERLVRQR